MRLGWFGARAGSSRPISRCEKRAWEEEHRQQARASWEPPHCPHFKRISRFEAVLRCPGRRIMLPCVVGAELTKCWTCMHMQSERLGAKQELELGRDAG
jgi:hypothetical protein